jgi:hypothetical protein
MLLQELKAALAENKRYIGDRRFCNKFPDLAKKILEAYPSKQDLPFLAKLTLVLEEKDSIPLCFCGNEARWGLDISQWSKYCSQKCSTKATAKERMISRRETCLKVYGATTATGNELVAEKRKLTMKKLYGTWNPMQDLATRIKQRRTCKLNYGVENPMQSEEIRTRIRKTCINRYGVDHPWKSEEVKARIRQTNLQVYGNCMPSKSHISEEVYAKLDSETFWKTEYFTNSKSIEKISRELGVSPTTCLNYFFKLGFTTDPLRKSKEEKVLYEFIKTFHFCQNNISLRSLGSSSFKMLDIYIPELKLAFEYNGIYWHSEEYRNPNYHLEKTLECEKLGIRLIHIWEDDWQNNESLMKHKIKALLGKEDKKVYARKCQVVIPTKEQKRIFYTQNHIKGNGGGSIDYALAFENELVAMITFKATEQGHDLNRYATSCSVPGGFSKLLEYFKRNNDWKRIYTFADRSWSQGNVYLKNGFSLVEEQAPTFYGIENCVRVNRLNYTHENLQKRFPDLKGTQFQIMDQADIQRIWDCGQLKFELVNNTEE